MTDYKEMWLGLSREFGLLEAEIEALRAENARLHNELEVSEAAHKTKTFMIVDLRAENARLKESLNPFAVVAEMTIGESEDDRDLFRPAHNGPRLIVADFRKARAAMGEKETEK